MSVTVTPLEPEIGIEITGLHGHAFVDGSVAAQCLDLLEQHGVVVYREASIGDDDLVAFSRLLGAVHERPSSDDSGYPEISIVSLDPGLSTAAAVQPGANTYAAYAALSEPRRPSSMACSSNTATPTRRTARSRGFPIRLARSSRPRRRRCDRSCGRAGAGASRC